MRRLILTSLAAVGVALGVSGWYARKVHISGALVAPAASNQLPGPGEVSSEECPRRRRKERRSAHGSQFSAPHGCPRESLVRRCAPGRRPSSRPSLRPSPAGRPPFTCRCHGRLARPARALVGVARCAAPAFLTQATNESSCASWRHPRHRGGARSPTKRAPDGHLDDGGFSRRLRRRRAPRGGHVLRATPGSSRPSRHSRTARSAARRAIWCASWAHGG